MMKIELSDEQQKIIDAIEHGENILITGVAGTGKSFIVDYINNQYHTTITATTGIAALNIGGVTIHSWAGIGIGSDPRETIVAKLLYNDFRQGVVDQIRDTERLVIDEISMLSAETLDLLDFVFQQVRGISSPFGGIQMILLGDFLQLPPVSKSGNTANFVFESESWRVGNFKVFELTHVFRQENKAFVTTLNNLRQGIVTEFDFNLLSSRIGTFPTDGIDPVMIYPKNKDADYVNMVKIGSLITDRFDYMANDLVDTMYERRFKHGINPKVIDYHTGNLDRNCLAPKHLILKIDAVVMLLKNLASEIGLVNGSMGTIKELTPDGPIVKFLNGVSRLIKTEKWESKDDTGNTVITRNQIPLRLAWAITIHKCLPRNTIVDIMGKGLIPLGDVIQGDFINTGQGSYKQVLNSFESGFKKSFTMQTSEGYSIESSKDHKFLTPSGFKELELLKVGDYIAIDRMESGNFIDSKITKELGWLMGLLVGDGCYSDKRDFRIDFTSRDSEVIDRALLFFKNNNLKPTIVNKNNNTKTIYIHNKKFREEIKDLGMGYTTGLYKTVPNSILLSDHDIQGAFLQGLFDSDGSCSKGGMIRLVSISKKLLSEVQLILLRLGIVSYISNNSKPIKKEHNQAYCLHILATSQKTFIDKVGFSIQYKKDRLKQSQKTNKDIIPHIDLKVDFLKYLKEQWGNTKGIKGRGYAKNEQLSKLFRTQNNTTYDALINTVEYCKVKGYNVPDFITDIIDKNYFWAKIKSINTDNSFVEMVDIEVDDDHSFWANGFVAHNCQGMTLDRVLCDLSNVFEYGQIYVAISRAKTLEGLYITSFDKNKVCGHPKAIEFYKSIQKKVTV